MNEDPSRQQRNDKETVGVIARPPFLFLGALLVGHVMDHFLPRPFVVPAGGQVHGIIGAFLVVIGLALAVSGIRNFWRAETPVPTYRPVSALVTTGIHGRTRNPIYLGMLLVYGGIGLAIRAPWTLLLMLPLAITIRYGVVAREEAYLERRFGDAYRAYKGRVRRWL
jgi:protein-S-isoprenylcysteine O-methyltransferase Ste14